MAGFRLTPAAYNSLIAIAHYTESIWGRTQRDAYLRKLDRAFRVLADRPEIGQARDALASGLRSFHEGSHVIFYLPEQPDVIIVDVLHERMDPTLLIAL